ncbi:hypothetical protein DVH05_011186 [Phytophthora capsici]|nr:hypothetical protein DVH05_011186 [Phytophthora capsici]
MASYCEDVIVDEDEDICGWGTVDFDDGFLDRGRRKETSKAVIKPKRRPQKTFSNTNSEIPILQKQQRPRPHEDDTQLEKRIRIANQVESFAGNQSPDCKPKRKPTQKLPVPKPPPRTSSILEGNAVIAALGRQRRMKVVAAAMATNVSRRPGLASVVSASFDEDDNEEPETPPRQRTDRVIPYPEPEKQQNKLPLVVAPPAAPIKVVKKIQPPLPLPLLSINQDCGGGETRLSGREKSTLGPLRNRRRHRQPKSSLLPSQDVSENWESNFRPSLRRLRSPNEYQTSGPTEESTKPASSSFNGAPPVPKQTQNATLRGSDLLPNIHHTPKDSGTAIGMDIPRTNLETPDHSDTNLEDDESWTRRYEDPEVAAISMAGLIQALSTFGKQKKTHKRKKRRTKQQSQVPDQQMPVNPPLLKFPTPGETNAASMIEEPRVRRRKHRKKLSE